MLSATSRVSFVCASFEVDLTAAIDAPKAVDASYACIDARAVEAALGSTPAWAVVPLRIEPNAILVAGARAGEGHASAGFAEAHELGRHPVPAAERDLVAVELVPIRASVRSRVAGVVQKQRRLAAARDALQLTRLATGQAAGVTAGSAEPGRSDASAASRIRGELTFQARSAASHAFFDLTARLARSGESFEWLATVGAGTSSDAQTIRALFGSSTDVIGWSRTAPLGSPDQTLDARDLVERTCTGERTFWTAPDSIHAVDTFAAHGLDDQTRRVRLRALERAVGIASGLVAALGERERLTRCTLSIGQHDLGHALPPTLFGTGAGIALGRRMRLLGARDPPATPACRHKWREAASRPVPT